MCLKSGRPTQAKRLEGNDLKALANYIKSDGCSNVFLMLGAGVSTSAGIPDFRSPETGLYANLERLNLPYPEAVFAIDFFRQNPIPSSLYASKGAISVALPTDADSFNIDTLERRAGVPEEKIVEAHGSFASQRCINCKRPYDDERMREAVDSSKIPRCDHCRGLVKPDIVFFGESLPEKFHRSRRTLHKADLLIVIGTSLTVHPFAFLADDVPKECPRVLINLVEVGSFHRPDDLVFLRKCDDIVRELCRELGWEEELDEAWNATKEIDKDREGLIPGEPGDKLDQVIKDMKSLTVSESKHQRETGAVDAKEVQSATEEREDAAKEEEESKSETKL